MDLEIYPVLTVEGGLREEPGNQIMISIWSINRRINACRHIGACASADRLIDILAYQHINISAYQLIGVLLLLYLNEILIIDILTHNLLGIP
jgi:hypothetical protein